MGTENGLNYISTAVFGIWMEKVPSKETAVEARFRVRLHASSTN